MQTQDWGHNNYSYVRYAEERFTQIYRNFYWDAMLMSIRMGTNMATGKQQKHLLLSFYKSVNLSLVELKKIKIIFFLIQELFR